MTGTNLQRIGQVEMLALDSWVTCTCVLHSPITLDSFPVLVRLFWSIVCAILQGTRKQGRLGSAGMENCLLGVHLSRSFLVKFVSLLLAFHLLGPTTFWVRPPVLSICVAFFVHLSTCASKCYLPLAGKGQRDAWASKGRQGLWWACMLSNAVRNRVYVWQNQYNIIK